MTQNRDFKYVVQDTSHAYLGAKMTFAELIEYEDVPFKIKSIVMKYAVPLTGEEGTFVDFFGMIKEDSFEYQVVKQLRVKIKAGTYETKVKRGKEEKKYKSGTYEPKAYMELIKSGKEFFTEEVVFNKLALLTFSS